MEPLAFLYALASTDTNQLFQPRDQNSVVLALSQPAEKVYRSVSRRQIQSQYPLFTAPNPFRRTITARVYLPEDKLWLQCSDQYITNAPDGSSVMKAWRDGGKRNGLPLLQAFWPDLGTPVDIPLALELKPAVIGDWFRQKLEYGSVAGGDLFVQPLPTPAGLVLINQMLGLWLISWTDLQTTLQATRQDLLARRQARAAAADSLWANLAQKYQLASRDKFTPDQKEAMIDDPAFLELNLDNIDANHNGKLDAAETVFFDANENSLLDPREQAGIDATLALLAQRLLPEYDLNLDGQLDQSEFDALVRDTTDAPARRTVLQQFDLDHNGFLSAAELRQFLLVELRASVNPRASLPPNSLDASLSAPAIVDYWVKSGARPDRRPAMRGPGMRLGPPGSTNIFQRPARPRPPTNAPPRTLVP